MSRGEIDLTKLEDEQEKEEHQKAEEEVKDLIERFKKALGEKVKDVRASTRLTTSPACLVVGEYDIDPNLKRLLKSAGQEIPGDKPILEINPQHPIIVKLAMGKMRSASQTGRTFSLINQFSVLAKNSIIQ